MKKIKRDEVLKPLFPGKLIILSFCYKILKLSAKTKSPWWQSNVLKLKRLVTWREFLYLKSLTHSCYGSRPDCLPDKSVTSSLVMLILINLGF